MKVLQQSRTASYIASDLTNLIVKTNRLNLQD